MSMIETVPILGIFLAKNGINCIRLNQEDFLNNVTVSSALCGNEYSYKMDVNNNKLHLDNISLVFQRDFNLNNHCFSPDSFINKFIV